MNLTTFLWTLAVVVLTVVKIIVTILVTTVKTIVANNDWLWTQGWNAFMSLLERVLGGPLMHGAPNIGLGNVLTTLVHDLTTCLYAAVGLVLSICTKLMTFTYWLVRYMVSKCRDLPHSHLKSNITEEKTLTIHDLS